MKNGVKMARKLLEVGTGMMQLEEMFDEIDLETLIDKEAFFILSFRHQCLSLIDKLDDKLELTEEERKWKGIK
ncbi:hypothetical protein [Helicobacter trogontum]|uniref:Uncharacterized protein n=1 Tax=Helicobacter trogontum TaxID=50960 RepID=A0A4U8S932_9HELI|nr:hypothetical protein [Helicobacter trogontum]TLD82503.1 hypothetical protein LS81_007885 [Helicobacter trogontum]